MGVSDGTMIMRRNVLGWRSGKNSFGSGGYTWVIRGKLDMARLGYDMGICCNIFRSLHPTI